MTRFGDLVPLRLSSAVGGSLSRLPDAVGRVVRPARYRSLPSEMPPIDPLPAAPRRVLIGALNTAGQAHRWAQAISLVPGTIGVSLSRLDTGFHFDVDIAVPSAVAMTSHDWQRKHARVRGFSATDVVIESGLPIFGPAFGWSLRREVRALQRRGIRVVVVCHGSDVRDVRALNARNPHSPYLLPQFEPLLPAMQRRAAERRRVIRTTGVPVLGSTHGVLIDMPEASWVPVVVDPASWATDAQPFAHNDPPLVVHAPSQAGIKGSEQVDAVLTALAGEGLVRYERLAGAAHDDVRRVYRRADIMVDSLRTGGFGVAACEAMAAGRLVVSNVAEVYRRDLHEKYGLELPIVQADPTTLASVLRACIAAPESSRSIAARGPAYVGALHDGRESARRILAALDTPAALGLRQ
ncbi:MAG: glycosyltransferase [Microcella pacifica]|uniref:glycosyltransferase n=1 Tax=Microcella pacifica TaxID=2591847 RepID=UPI003315400C